TELLEPTEKSLQVINELFKEMEIEGSRLLESENIKEEKRIFIRTIDIRFKGQNYELSVPVELAELKWENIDNVISKFHEIHEKTYGYSDKLAKVEFVNYRLTACGKLPKVSLKKGNETDAQILSSNRKREVYFSEVEEPGFYNADIFQRTGLDTGDKINGPAIVEQLDSTILILPGQTGLVDPYQNLIINVSSEVKN